MQHTLMTELIVSTNIITVDEFVFKK